ncbi:carbon-nitrogen hydrolase family protein [Dyadobacter fanqingshengii]|uniref:Carbon-nitrogen hydrolase family protein n=1 Tax=Dyadobacter fanqingshengii TaxID=2906443 RepID=A0A9X1PBV3_9BACT|nr:carbon-nitrogen hydrolase family protein [Dyadobacter fanqingshengii]MCF0042116.1 carbon-nitrogen hydrolase family protein [Dyadobacter fanqingshengii]MCF2506306.1 carbon-nitrogen hydrolase family protein [Dyadobacter fanqingshengii]USJ35349.1 carbon-nitrogen hydrolase family protein [Dyadobacter fanqingshengii]
MFVTIASAQYPITEHADFAAWQKHIENWVSDAAAKGAELLLFPEYGAMELVSILSPDIKSDILLQVAAMDNFKESFCDVFAELAVQHNVIIVAPSLPVIEDGQHLNRVFVFSKKGLAGYQDKFFMTRFENEDWGIQSAPKVLTVFEASWGKFGIQICYDVEFALGSQSLCNAGASLILAPSCTETIRGATRVHVGARARALENQVYVTVSQTVGNAEWSPAVDINYGYAAFYSTPDKDLPEEGIIAIKSPQQEGWLIQELDFTKIGEVRRDGHVFNFSDQRKVSMEWSGEKLSIQHTLV